MDLKPCIIKIIITILLLCFQKPGRRVINTKLFQVSVQKIVPRSSRLGSQIFSPPGVTFTKVKVITKAVVMGTDFVVEPFAEQILSCLGNNK